MDFADVNAIVSFVTTQKLQDWQKTLFKKYADEVQVHSQGQLFYKLDTLFPNENPASKETRMLSFEPITKASFNKGVSNVYRMFSNSSYSADMSEKTAQYLAETKFDNQDLFSYFLELWTTTALKQDANSLIVVYPEKFMKDKAFNQVLTISSEDIVYFDDNTFIFKSEAESKIQFSVNAVFFSRNVFYDESIKDLNIMSACQNTYNQKVIKTYQLTVWHAFVKNKFYRIAQTEDSNQFDVTIYDLGKNIVPPVVFAGGLVTNKVYESFLSPFIYFGNLALLQHSQHTAVNFMFSFPRMSELQPVCDYPLCDSGSVPCDIDEAHPTGRMTCPQCNGTGYKSSQSPYKTYIKKYDPSGFDESSTKDFLNTDDVRFYTPPVQVLDYSKNEWRDYLKMAEESIFIMQKVYTGQVQSAESKNIDLDELYAFLISISKVFYDRLRFVLQSFENYLVGSPRTVTVNVPYSFAILTEQEAFLALNSILTSTAPAIIKGNQIESFISKFVSDSSPVKKAYEVLKQVDLLFLKSDAEIQILKSNNIVTSDAWVIHTFAYPVLMNLYSADKALFEQDTDEVVSQLQAELQQYKPVSSDLKTQLQNQFINNGNGAAGAAPAKNNFSQSAA